ncbi:MAG: hypothetical protein KZQ92_07665 [Candidatus Thiodiazotropha sp. (ex Lucinoma borealis)]|nr:hypothetical protein [Candidatus Thiodiazotropha sp. (ex Lucinoma borealis)]MCU7857896.1 hypothetical protein [Candidatus Thiodiazotropha sp. (ex Lucinoma borealis)]MCU7863840.1 hypothetical protein [Candidatus Thiodiazotropha sp. (ex Lucinoma borealis)]MCU7870967.1 hypothetical protein [Candidatus Thiodiazotropha sp. (ex Lucinoma borealis)]
MAYPKDSPLKDKVIRIMVTAACYVEISIAADGEWDSDELEKVIDGKGYASYTGHYRRLFRGIVPNDQSVIFIKLKLTNECDLLKWRDHPFWKLLSNRSLTHSDIEAALMTVTSNVKHYIWMRHRQIDVLPTTRRVRVLPERESIERIAKYRNFDSLLTLVAYAREGRDSGMLQEYGISAELSLKIFPDVIARNPHLYIRWKSLAKRLNSLIWNPKRNFAVELKREFSLSQLNEEIEELVDKAREKGACFPPKELMKRFG